MLPRVWSVIDHRWRQNAVRTKSGTRGDSNETTTEEAFFISKSFNITRKPAFAYFGKHGESHLTQSVAKTKWSNHATVKLDSSVTSRGTKTYSESIIELWNLRILKKALKNNDSFCHESSSVIWKAWTLPWILRELRSETYGCGQHWRSFHSSSSFEWKEC